MNPTIPVVLVLMLVWLIVLSVRKSPVSKTYSKWMVDNEIAKRVDSLASVIDCHYVIETKKEGYKKITKQDREKWEKHREIFMKDCNRRLY